MSNSEQNSRVGFGINLISDCFKDGILLMDLSEFKGGIAPVQKLDGISHNPLAQAKELCRVSNVGRDCEIQCRPDSAVVIDKSNRLAFEIIDDTIRYIKVNLDDVTGNYYIKINDQLKEIEERSIFKAMDRMNKETQDFYNKSSIPTCTGALIEIARGELFSAHARDDLFKDFEGDTFVIGVGANSRAATAYEELENLCENDEQLMKKAINKILGDLGSDIVEESVKSLKNNDCYDAVIVNISENSIFGLTGDSTTRKLNKGLCLNQYGTYAIEIKGKNHNIMEVDVVNRIKELKYVDTIQWIAKGHSLKDVALIAIAEDMLKSDRPDIDAIVINREEGKIYGLKDNQIVEAKGYTIDYQQCMTGIVTGGRYYPVDDSQLTIKFNSLQPKDYTILINDGYSKSDVSLMYIAKDLLSK